MTETENEDPNLLMISNTVYALATEMRESQLSTGQAILQYASIRAIVKFCRIQLMADFEICA